MVFSNFVSKIVLTYRKKIISLQVNFQDFYFLRMQVLKKNCSIFFGANNCNEPSVLDVHYQMHCSRIFQVTLSMTRLKQVKSSAYIPIHVLSPFLAEMKKKIILRVLLKRREIYAC